MKKMGAVGAVLIFMCEEWDRSRHRTQCSVFLNTSNNTYIIVQSRGTAWLPQTTSDVKNVFRCWYRAQGLKAVMWKSWGCEGGATLPLALAGDKSCECARGWLLFDRLDVKHTSVSQASQGHRLGGIPAWFSLETEASPSPSTQRHTRLGGIRFLPPTK